MPVEPAKFDLGRVQNWMQAVVTHPDGIEAGASADDARKLIEEWGGSLESMVTRSKALSATDRLAIYGNAYFARLLECVGEVFPILKRTLGEETFNAFAFGYLQDYPSTSYTLHDLGRHFVGYLRETRPPTEEVENREVGIADWPAFLIDLARLEWTIYEVFDGPGMEGLDTFKVNGFLTMDPSRWGDFWIRCSPSLKLLTVDYPVNDYYTEGRKQQADFELGMPDRRRQYLAVTRRNYVVRRYEMSFPEYELLDALRGGAVLEDALLRCSDAAEVAGVTSLENDMPVWFRNWAAEGCFLGGIEGPDSLSP